MELMERTVELLMNEPIFRIAFPLAILLSTLKTAYNIIFSCDLSGTYSTNKSVERKEIKEVEVAPAKIPLDNLSGYWTCPYCDGLNKKKHLVCTHCNAPRKE